MDDDAMASLLEKYGEISEEFENRGGYDLETRAQTVLTGLGIGPADHSCSVWNHSTADGTASCQPQASEGDDCKGRGVIARFKARASHAAQVQSRIKKIERIEIPEYQKIIKFVFRETPRSGEDVASFENLSKTWKTPGREPKTVFSNLSGLVRRQDKIAVVGVNGAGKSTFLKLIAGQTEPTSGTVNTGAGVNTGYFSQHAMDLLTLDKTVLETLQETLPTENIGVIRNLLASFLFSGNSVDKKIKSLSGGEKSRVVLATLLAKPVNFLILDEPTNHLDIQSREILLRILREFSGTIVLVSPDRFFLRSLVNQVFEIDHGEMVSYKGNYEYYLSKTGRDHKTI